MKIWWNRKYTTIAVYAFLVIAASVLFVLAIANIGIFWGFLNKLLDVLQPFIIGFAIAYLLNPGYRFLRFKVFEKLFKKKPMPRLAKVLSVIVLYIFALGLLAFLLWFVIPQVIKSVEQFLDKFDSYYKSLDKLIIQFSSGNANIKDIGTAGTKALYDYFAHFNLNSLNQMFDVTIKITSGITSLMLGIVISIYMLYNKDQFGAQLRKVGSATLSEKYFKRIEKVFDQSHSSFGKYISGKLLDALVIGSISFIVMSLVHMPYAILLSVIIGVSNLIPFFGPIFAIFVCVLLVLMVNPNMAIWCFIIILILQQIDGNFIDPRIVGQKTGLLAFWVIFAVLLGGGFFGIIGIIVAVPLFSVLYSIVNSLVSKRLESKSMSACTKDYFKD